VIYGRIQKKRVQTGSRRHQLREKSWKEIEKERF
jgi:hypothetical protein